MNEQEAYKTLLESVSPYYSAIGDLDKLKILLELRKIPEYGMELGRLRDQLNLSEDNFEGKINNLRDLGLVEKTETKCWISKSGMGLLRHVDDTMKTMIEILKARKDSHP